MTFEPDTVPPRQLASLRLGRLVEGRGAGAGAEVDWWGGADWGLRSTGGEGWTGAEVDSLRWTLLGEEGPVGSGSRRASPQSETAAEDGEAHCAPHTSSSHKLISFPRVVSTSSSTQCAIHRCQSNLSQQLAVVPRSRSDEMSASIFEVECHSY